MSVSGGTTETGLIAWWAGNPVAANLLMLIIIFVGTLSGIMIKRTMMPEFDIPIIRVIVPYPGAAPEEVESGVVLRIEEALSDLDGIERIESDSRESVASIIIEPSNEDDIVELMNDIKNRIDAIPQFPANAEEATIGRVELPFQALIVQIAGDLDERAMTALAKEIRLEMTTNPDISAVSVWGTRDYEIAIEIPEHRLQEYHLSLEEVARVIAAASIDLPGGAVRTEHGDILLRTRGQAYRQGEFEQIVLRTFPDGTRLLLGDIAEVNDGFVDDLGFAMFDGKYSVALAISAMGEQDILTAAAAAKRYVEEKNKTLPDNVRLTVWGDFSYHLDQRLSMMTKNLAMGALVVFLVLALFLEVKLAFWVMVGIPICFLGSMAFFASPFIGGTLNVVSAFGFIVVLGIVVDDAIIIGESAYTEQEENGHSLHSVVVGAKRVATPATFGVLTTIAAFAPTLFIQGDLAVFGEAIGYVVIFCLLFSLVESKWILPAHLAHSRPAKARLLLAIDRVQENVNRRLRRFVEERYGPFVRLCVRNRYTTLAAFIGAFILVLGLMLSGQVRVVFNPEVQGESLSMDLTMSDGTSQQRTIEVVRQVEEAIRQVDRRHSAATGGEENLLSHTFVWSEGRAKAGMFVELTRAEKRSINAEDVVKLWREETGEIPGAEVFSISSEDGPGIGPAISFDLSHADWESLRTASLELEGRIRQYAGVYDVQSSVSEVSDEFHFELRPEAEALGITRRDLGSQIRQAFYGAEAQRIQRGTDEIKVMVRYPLADRRTTATLDSMFIRTPGGDAVPFNSVATMTAKPGFREITRIDFQRAVEVTAEVHTDIVEPGRISREVVGKHLPELQRKYPGLEYDIAGMTREESKAGNSLLIGLGIAMFAIYSLLAIPTKSYLQPLIIMGVIPFGIIGAVIGHILLGYAISLMSAVGIIALSGVVVNDSLIMVDFVNRAVRGGMDRAEAAVRAGMRRFRAIILTSLTTFCALTPMLTESSVQAEVIIPMAISLAFGIIFATVITLGLVPCLYVVLDDLDRLFARKKAELVYNAGFPQRD